MRLEPESSADPPGTALDIGQTLKKSGTVWYHTGHMVRTVDFTHNRCMSCLWPVVYIATMADLEQKDNQFSLIDLTDDPIISDTISP